MVDVSAKPETARVAVATGRIRMSAEALAAILGGTIPKGDVFAAARIAGIMAAKRTAELIPLCHPLPISSAHISFKTADNFVEVAANIATTGRTGVEMEALVAVNLALLTIYDMAKAIDKAMVVEAVHLVSKTGGKSGDWRFPG